MAPLDDSASAASHRKINMSARKNVITWVAVVMTSMVTMVAQQKPTDKDAGIVSAMQKVSAAQLKANDEKLVSFRTRHTLSSAMPADSGKGIAAAAKWIQSEFERYSKACGGCLEVKEDSFTQEPGERIPNPIQLTNVYAILRGSDPASATRMIVMSGHYDSRCSETNDIECESPGANDDGSGTIAVLEAARVLSQHKFPATIIFLTVAGEEQGLYGSKHFAKMAKAEGWDIEADLNNDIVGGDNTPGQDPTKVRVFSEGIPVAATPQELRLIRAIGAENDSPSRALARYISDVGNQYFTPGKFGPVMIYRQDRYLRGGDHTSFNEAGYAAVRFTEWRENYNHQHQTPRTENGIEYGDWPKFVNFDYVANVTRLNLATLASLASAPAPPGHVRLLTRELVNDSTLQWEASAGGRVAAYEVVWRSTDSPVWAGVKNVGTATSATLPISKDNVIFGVRSVDAKGHRSLVVTPVPGR
jgi:hypothetical protein